MLRGNTLQRGLLFMWLCLAAVSITLGWLIFALSRQGADELIGRDRQQTGDRAVPPPQRAQNLQQLQAEGIIDTVLSGPRGETNGVILNDGSIVLFPPEGMQVSIKVGM